MSEAIAALGTSLVRNGVEIAEVTNISGPKLSADTIEVTHLKSPNAMREFIGSLKDGGELTFDINFIMANPTHNAATGLLAPWAGAGAPPVDDWDMIFPDDASTTWSFQGILTGFETGAAFDGKLSASVTVRTTGALTLS